MTTDTLAIADTLQSTYEHYYFSKGFRDAFEDMIPYLKRNNAELHVVDKEEAHRFHKNLSLYLYNQGLPYQYHWMIMRLNDMKTFYEFTENTSYILTLNADAIENLIAQYSILKDSR